MKISIRILAVYLFAISLAPCSDNGGGVLAMLDEVFELEEAPHSDHDQHNNSCDDDMCSPLCTCNCCASLVDEPTALPYQIQAPSLPFPASPVNLITVFSHPFHYPVWEPPRLV